MAMARLVWVPTSSGTQPEGTLVDQCPENWLFRELCCDPGWLSCPAGGSRQLAQGRDLESRTGKPSSAFLWPGPHRRAEQGKMETQGPAPCPQCKGLWRLVF